MWAETYHSFSDTINQVLLLVGIKTSKKEAGKKHPFGHGKEQFFWSFIVSTLIFSVSGVLSLEQGIPSLLGHEKHKLDDIPINFIILGIASVFEGNSLRTAFKEFKRPIEERGGKLNLYNDNRIQREQKSLDFDSNGRGYGSIVRDIDCSNSLIYIICHRRHHL